MDGMPEQNVPPQPGMIPGGAGVTGEAGRGPEGQPAPPGGSPTGSSMSAPTGKAGERQAAKMWVAHVALPALEKALMALGSSSPEGQAVLTALKALSKDFGTNRDQDLGMNSMMALLGKRAR